MATQRRTIDDLADQLADAGAVAFRPMFGEYGLYVDGRLAGLVCDDRLFVKPTAAGRAHAGPVAQAPPYPGAKRQLVIDGDRWEDAGWLAALLRATAAELPMPRPRKPKAGR